MICQTTLPVCAAYIIAVEKYLFGFILNRILGYPRTRVCSNQRMLLDSN